MKHFAPAISVLAVLSLGACMPVTDDGQTSSASSSSMQAHEDMIIVESPDAGDEVASPLTVTGEARGNWYFEASFPVALFDGNGTQIAIEPAEAQGDWMTTDFVPFSVTLTFATPTTATGTLVLMRDNPSGLPENDASVSIPVTF